MSALTFGCPTTGKVIESGIETDPQTLASIWGVDVRVRCPHCNAEHDLVVRDRRGVEDAASSDQRAA
jgi:hypothetical protein